MCACWRPRVRAATLIPEYSSQSTAEDAPNTTNDSSSEAHRTSENPPHSITQSLDPTFCLRLLSSTLKISVPRVRSPSHKDFSQRYPSTFMNLLTSSVCSMESPSRKGNGTTNCTGGNAILKLLWGRNMLYLQEFGDLRPYETCKMNAEFALRVLSEHVRICSRFGS